MDKQSVFLVRYMHKWKWIRIKSFEPERMSTDVAWIQIKENVSPEEAYRIWFERQRKISRVLQQ